jgi:RecA-family ATPase
VVLDTLTRFAGGDTEKDSAQATRFIQAVESLCKAPGSPTVLVAHHTNKISRQEGAATSSSNSRGSSALTDGARWVANLESLSDESAKLTITKSNYAMSGPPVMLARDSANGGLLRVEAPEVARARAEHAAAMVAQQRFALMRERVLSTLAHDHALATRGDVARAVGGRKQEVLGVLKELLERGEVALVGGAHHVVERGSA